MSTLSSRTLGEPQTLSRTRLETFLDMTNDQVIGIRMTTTFHSPSSSSSSSPSSWEKHVSPGLTEFELLCHFCCAVGMADPDMIVIVDCEAHDVLFERLRNLRIIEIERYIRGALLCWYGGPSPKLTALLLTRLLFLIMTRFFSCNT